MSHYNGWLNVGFLFGSQSLLRHFPTLFLQQKRVQGAGSRAECSAGFRPWGRGWDEGCGLLKYCVNLCPQPRMCRYPPEGRVSWEWQRRCGVDSVLGCVYAMRNVQGCGHTSWKCTLLICGVVYNSIYPRPPLVCAACLNQCFAERWSCKAYWHCLALSSYQSVS